MRAAYEEAEWPWVAVRGTLPGGRPVVALVRDAATRDAIRAAVGRAATVSFCDHATDLVRIAIGSGSRLVVAEPRDVSGDSTAPALSALRLRSPQLRVVLHFSLTPEDVRDAAACFPASVVLRHHDDLGRAIRAELSGAARYTSPGAVLETTAALVPPIVRPFFGCCAWRAHRLRTVHDAAAEAGMAVRTLSRRLRDCGLPAPKRVLEWYRLLHAAWHIEAGAIKRDAVAHRVGLASGETLGDTLRHCTGLSWPELRDRVRLAGLLERFDALLRAPRPGPPATKRWRHHGASERPK